MCVLYTFSSILTYDLLSISLVLKRSSFSKIYNHIFTNPSTRAGCDTRSIFKRSLTVKSIILLVHSFVCKLCSSHILPGGQVGYSSTFSFNWDIINLVSVGLSLGTTWDKFITWWLRHLERKMLRESSIFCDSHALISAWPQIIEYVKSDLVWSQINPFPSINILKC